MKSLYSKIYTVHVYIVQWKIYSTCCQAPFISYIFILKRRMGTFKAKSQLKRIWLSYIAPHFLEQLPK